MAKALLILLVLLAGCGGGKDSTGASTSLSLALNWTVPTRNADGTVLTNIASYRIAYGSSPTNLTKTITVPASQTSLKITGLGAGTYYATVTTINSLGEASDPAGPVSGPAQ
jgi:predicted phage tail protein